jgi:hypothetical protein
MAARRDRVTHFDHVSRYPVPLEPARAGSFQRPNRRLTVVAGGIDVQPGMRVKPMDLRHDALHFRVLRRIVLDMGVVTQCGNSQQCRDRGRENRFFEQQLTPPLDSLYARPWFLWHSSAGRSILTRTAILPLGAAAHRRWPAASA